jgi:hypothetical protein
VETWSTLVRTAHQCELALRHGWYQAARQLEQELAPDVDHLQRQLVELAAALAQRKKAPSVSSLGDIYSDLLALEQEFEELECDLQAGEICVTTEPIVLNGIELGPFQICLATNPQAGFGSYRVVALEPNPSLANESVSHPHISDESLCEGDGHRAIQAALHEGRLLDFFTLVNQILATYSPGRAYVELDEWFGLTCSECGEYCRDDERCYCDRCEAVLCGSCATCCDCCDQSYCRNCLTNCDDCGQSCCDHCGQPCTACRETFCSDCLINGKCEECHEKNAENDEPEASGSAPADIEVRPDCLGEAAVPA